MLRLLLIVSLFALSACVRLTPAQPAATQSSGRDGGVPAPGVSIRLAPVERRRDHLVMRVEVTNHTPELIVWDEQMSVYHGWGLRLPGGTYLQAQRLERVMNFR
jgi:hypothetical protein